MKTANDLQVEALNYATKAIAGLEDLTEYDQLHQAFYYAYLRGYTNCLSDYNEDVSNIRRTTTKS